VTRTAQGGRPVLHFGRFGYKSEGAHQFAPAPEIASDGDMFQIGPRLPKGRL
jgi:hypothetical protein